MPKRPRRLEKVWLEVALNGAAGPRLQPRIPTTPEAIVAEGIACARAGAAIVHLHAYDSGGSPCEDAELYARMLGEIREATGAIVYPTLALRGDADSRHAPIRSLGERGLLEWGVVDPGSVNVTHRIQVAAGRDGLLYANPDDHVRMGLELAREHGWRPSYAIYEPGFVRAGAAWAGRVPELKTPVYRLMLTDDFCFGLPPEPFALDAYVELLARHAPDAPFMLSGFGGDLSPLAEPALALGAHWRVGLEDARLGCERSNLELVEEAVRRIQGLGYELATPDEVRAAG